MREKEKSATGLKVTVKPLGPTREELMATGERALTLASVRKFIGRGKARLLYVEMLEDDDLYQRSPGTLALEGQKMAQDAAAENTDKVIKAKKVAGQDGATGADDTTHSEETNGD